MQAEPRRYGRQPTSYPQVWRRAAIGLLPVLGLVFGVGVANVLHGSAGSLADLVTSCAVGVIAILGAGAVGSFCLRRRRRHS